MSTPTRRRITTIVLAIATAVSITTIGRASASAPRHPDQGTVAGGVADAGRGPQRPGSQSSPRFVQPAVAPAGYPVTGIDVSSWQGTVNWPQVAATAKFAYVKATEGTTYVSPTFATQYAGARAAGLYTGAYAYARPDAAPVPQADFFVSQIRSRFDSLALPPMVDLEWPYLAGGKYVAPYPCFGLTPTAMVTWIRSFVDEVRARTGSLTVIYTATSWWNQCTGNSTSFADEPLAIALYTATPPATLPSGWSRWTFWQYADAGSLPGDQDVFNGSLSQLAALPANTRCRVRPSPVLGLCGSTAIPRPIRNVPLPSR
jgi:GH25 family lysozyme M1 (1,4-beta-N-acetylmuramidase)